MKGIKLSCRRYWIDSKYDMEKERQQAEAAECEAHERSIKEWEAQMKAKGMDHPALPSGPTPPRPKVVPSIELPLAARSHPPRPPLSALPKHSSMETSSSASKHASEPPTAQAPPSKQVRCKAFPKSSQPPDQVYVAASATVEMPQPCRPCPKGPPATYLPTPPEIASMKTDSYEEDRKARLNEEGPVCQGQVS